jgi:predicted enzyme related to lactoylglutathione lyase
MSMNAINWFEIFVSDFNRARRFYEKALDIHMEVVDGMGAAMGMFPCDAATGVGGCITAADQPLVSSATATRVYLNVEGKLDAVVQRVPANGGKIIQDRTSIAPHGFIALMQDSEGNLVGLHSMT